MGIRHRADCLRCVASPVVCSATSLAVRFGRSPVGRRLSRGAVARTVLPPTPRPLSQLAAVDRRMHPLFGGAVDWVKRPSWRATPGSVGAAPQSATSCARRCPVRGRRRHMGAVGVARDLEGDWSRWPWTGFALSWVGGPRRLGLLALPAWTLGEEKTPLQPAAAARRGDAARPTCRDDPPGGAASGFFDIPRLFCRGRRAAPLPPPLRRQSLQAAGRAWFKPCTRIPPSWSEITSSGTGR